MEEGLICSIHKKKICRLEDANTLKGWCHLQYHKFVEKCASSFEIKKLEEKTEENKKENIENELKQVLEAFCNYFGVENVEETVNKVMVYHSKIFIIDPNIRLSHLDEKTILGILFYIVMKEMKVPVSIIEINDLFCLDVSSRTFYKTYQRFSKILNKKIMPTKTQDYIIRFCKMLNLDENIKSKALELADKTESINTGKNPIYTAITCIYLASLLCNESSFYYQYMRGWTVVISNSIEIYVVLLNKRVREMAKFLGLNLRKLKEKVLFKGNEKNEKP
jgi:transcription initiation factor TFIIIB Brf1 subunit/transcription initiation factor TFIIB